MRKRGVSLGLGIALLVVVPASEAVAKEVCCYRVHANASNQLHVEDHGGTAPGAQNGTYDLSSTWALRELVRYNPKRYGDAHFNPVSTRDRREIPWMAKFKGSESSNQSYIDNDGRRVDYPPCRYAKDVPWHRAGGSPLLGLDLWLTEREGPYFTAGQDVSEVDFGGRCDNTAPFYGGSSTWPYPHFDPQTEGVSSYPGDSHWDAYSSHIQTVHTTEGTRVIFKKLKKMKDQVVTFEPPTTTATSQVANPHTYTVTHRTAIRFTWFPRDRLQKELNELNALK